jgi:hypothetical protein
MLGFSKRINKNYAIDFAFFTKIRMFNEGISFINFDIALDIYKADHNPQARIFLCLFNFTIIDICFYNINHFKENQ